jgi:hypothetical protein
VQPLAVVVQLGHHGVVFAVVVVLQLDAHTRRRSPSVRRSVVIAVLRAANIIALCARRPSAVLKAEISSQIQYR